MSAEAPRNSGISNFAARIKQAVVDGMDMASRVERERVEQGKAIGRKQCKKQGNPTKSGKSTSGG